MTPDLATFRLNLASAKADLRLAKDTYEMMRAIAENQFIGDGTGGRNAEERARNLTIALLDHEGYQGSLRYLRECERRVDELHAMIAVEEDAIRMAELAARERLAEALLGKRMDDAYADALAEDAQGSYNGKTDRDFPF